MSTTTEAVEDYWSQQDAAIAATKKLIKSGLRRRELAKGTRKNEPPFAFQINIPRAEDNERF
jgi:hypothetical protein